MPNDIFNTKEILPDQESVYQALKSDTLNRVDLACYLFEMINTPSFEISSIAIDGQWGSGKTFFVQMLKMLIDSYAKNSDLKKEYSESIIQLTKQKYANKEMESIICPIYYDSWLNDSMAEPVLSLLHTICKQTNTATRFAPKIEKITKSLCNSTVNFFLKAFSIYAQAPDLVKIKDALCQAFSSESPFSSVIDTEQLQLDIKELLEKIVKKINKPLVIFIDELDRCKPSYAIKLLEAIKHYFFNDKILFVFSVNLSELQHSVRCIYGQDFDATRYLDRFFNVRFNLPSPVVRTYLERQYNQNKLKGVSLEITEYLASEYNLQLREICKFGAQISLITKSISFQEYDYYDSTKTFISLIFVPIALCLKFVDLDQYRLFISGNGQEILKKLSSTHFVKYYCSLYLGEKTIPDNLIYSTLFTAYRLLFTPKNENVKRRLGKCEFYPNCGEFFLRKVGFFS